MPNSLRNIILSTCSSLAGARDEARALVSCTGIFSAATSGLSDMIRALMVKQAPSRKGRDVQKLLRARRHTF